MNKVPVDVWLLLHEFLPSNCHNPVCYLDLALICRSAYTAFCSDTVWSQINPYDLDSGIYKHFMVAKTVLNPTQRHNLRIVWEFVRGNVIGRQDTVPYLLHKEKLPNLDAEENEYYNLGLLLCSTTLLGQPRLKIIPVRPELLARAIRLDPRVEGRTGVIVPTDTSPIPFLEPRELENLDPGIIEVELSTNGLLLQFCTLEMRRNPTLVKIAVASDGRALRYASDDLRYDEDMVLRARCSRISVMEEETYSDPFYDQFAEGDPYLAIVNEMNKRIGLIELESEGLRHFNLIV